MPRPDGPDLHGPGHPHRHAGHINVAHINAAQSHGSGDDDGFQMPPMSGDEALRRFQNKQAASGHQIPSETAELDRLSPVMRLAVLGGTLALIVMVVVAFLYLAAA